MIYFKCSACGEKMEAPNSLRGQLLKCPNCGLHMKAKKSKRKKYVLLSIFMAVVAGFFITIGLYSHGWLKGRDIGYDFGYAEGVKDTLKLGESLKAYEKRQKQQHTNKQKDSHINDNIYRDDFEIPGGFFCHNLQLRPDYSNKTCGVLGEITNNSGENYTMANFNISIYDQQSVLMDVEYLIIANLINQQTKSFEARLDNINQTIGYCKIDFESGL